MAIAALASGCSSVPHNTDDAGQNDSATRKIQKLQSEQEKLQATIAALNSKVNGMEATLGTLTDTIESTRANVEHTFGNGPAKLQGLGNHSVDQGGIPVLPSGFEEGYVSDDAVQKFRQAMVLFESRSYPDAVLAFSNFVDQYPDHALAGSAQYFLGESYFKQGEFKLAAREFQRVLTSYDRSPHVSETLRDLAASEEKLGDSAGSSRHQQLLTSLFPQSPAASAPAEVPQPAALTQGTPVTAPAPVQAQAPAQTQMPPLTDAPKPAQPKSPDAYPAETPPPNDYKLDSPPTAPISGGTTGSSVPAGDQQPSTSNP